MVNSSFVIDNEGTLSKYLGEPKRFTVYREGGDIVAQIRAFFKNHIQTVFVPGETVRKIGYKAFKNCSVETLRLEEGIRAVELGAFLDCPSLRTIWMPHSMQSFYSYCLPVRDEKVTICVRYARGAWKAFQKAGFTLKNIPRDLWQKHSGLFIALKLACQKAVSLNIHVYEEEDLSDYEFLGLHFDCGFTFHSGIKAKFIFQKSMPRTVTIEKDVSYIDPQAFSSSGEVFFEDTSIERIDVALENPMFYSKDGILFDRDRSLLRFPQGKILHNGCFYIPDDTRAVAEGAFDGAYSLEKLVVPKGVVLMEGALVNTPNLEVVWREETKE